MHVDEEERSIGCPAEEVGVCTHVGHSIATPLPHHYSCSLVHTQIV